MAKTWKSLEDGEIELVITSPTRDVFYEKYLKAYKDKVDPFILPKRAGNIWYRREELKLRLEKKRKAQHTLLIPKTIVTKATPPGKSENIPDIGELLVKCCNLLTEIAAIQKEQLELFRKLSVKG